MAAARYFPLAFVLWGKDLMSIETPIAAEPPAEAEAAPAVSEWAETALTVLFTAAAVLFVSFLAVATGLV